MTFARVEMRIHQSASYSRSKTTIFLIFGVIHFIASTGYFSESLLGQIVIVAAIHEALWKSCTEQLPRLI